MSIRKLTNVQEARRVLRERRHRCMLHVDQEAIFNYTTRERIQQQLRRSSRTRNALTTEDVAQIIRKAGRDESKKPKMTRVSRQLNKFETEMAFAVKEPYGVVRFWVHRFPTDVLRSFQKVTPSKLRGLRVAGSGDVIPQCGPCSQREFVAIDTLLETGDRYAEHLAKQCAKGGGFLEGAPRRRRRRRK